ncbi:hypothetical protein DFH28DRAFT_930286 [Melampsora americana]|nr:hypothetical protein DFH28DRAFT_930286 [Melampsora americana]
MNGDQDEVSIGDDDLNIFEEPANFRPATPEAQVLDFVRTNGDKLNIRLVGGHPLWGHVLYPAAILMSKYLEQNADTLLRSVPGAETARGKFVLELGAGAGLPGLTSAFEGAELVVTTDFPDADLIDNLKHNADVNLPPQIRDRMIVDGYTWGANPAHILSHLPILDACDAQTSSNPVSPLFDLILLSDLVFNHSQHEALLLTCERFLRQPSNTDSHTPCLLVFFSHHRPKFMKEDNQLIELAQTRGWTCKKVVEDRNAGLAFPKDEGDPSIRGTVHGWMLTR